jgi:hypothetical protein
MARKLVLLNPAALSVEFYYSCNYMDAHHVYEEEAGKSPDGHEINVIYN